MENFDQLDIDGASIDLLEINPSKKIDLKIFNSEGKEYFITFFKVASFQVNLSSRPYEKIISHSLLANSLFLDRAKAEIYSHDESKLIHYQIKCDSGEIDIVCEGFVYSLIWDSKGRGTLIKRT